MRFVDEAHIIVSAGRGGDGSVAFRREAKVPRGGPSGGNGGKGGDVLFVATANRPTLLDIRNQQHYRAEPGGRGGNSRKAGRSGSDLVLEVPVGPLVYAEESDELLCDLAEPAQIFVAAKGGDGGRGNATFKTSRRQTPDFATSGHEGEERRLRLELKVLADVGIVGLPNVGKSSLIRNISASRARVADYPFTTLVPNLGVVSSTLLGSFVVADIPGLIPGAHDGAGLGLRFLRHVERTRLLVHVLSAVTEASPEADYEAIGGELRQYSPELWERPQILVLNKVDAVPRGEREQLVARVRQFAERHGHSFAAVSCATGDGVQSFSRLLERDLFDLIPPPPQVPFDPLNV
jgi:GTP-binding protein